MPRQLCTLLQHKVCNTSQFLSNGQQWGIEQLNVPDTWKITKGKGVSVMVIDTGLSDHYNLSAAINKKKSKNFCKTETIIDENGHSTHCCGIVAARGLDNVWGVAPEAEIIVAKALDRDGAGSTKQVLNALKYALDIKPDVISMSLGYYFKDQEMENVIKELYRMNIPIIAAAGNDGNGNRVDFPAKFQDVICVGAYDKDGNHADFSNESNNVDFAAPGVGIYNTWLYNQYASLSGTSMATPFVAGIVALLLAKHRKQEKETGKNDCKTVAQIKEHLIKYADDKGVVGKDKQYGYGVIDLTKLINDQEKNVKEPAGSPIIDMIVAFFRLFFRK